MSYPGLNGPGLTLQNHASMRLQTTYLGLPLRTPIVVSACPLSEDVDNIVRMEKAGAGAVDQPGEPAQCAFTQALVAEIEIGLVFAGL